MYRLRMKSVVIVQFLGTLLLIGGTWFVAEYDKGKEVLGKWMTQDVVASGWFADSPVHALLFSFASPVTRVQAYPSGWYAPVVSGEITETFAKTGKGIVLLTEQPSEIRAVGDGKVVLCAPPDQESATWTVVIAHADDTKSVYGMLAQASVRVGETVKGGQAIGWIQEDQLYFAFKQGGLFLDPVAVIGFD